MLGRMARLWHTWLPTELQPLVSTESERFAALIEGFEKDVTAALKSGTSQTLDNCGAVVAWIPLINNFLPEKTPYPVESLNKLASLFIEIVLHTSDDVEVQVRSAETLGSLLRIYRKELTIRIDWRPLYNLLRSQFSDSIPKLEGLTLAQTRLHSLTKVVRRSRRFFPDGAAAEIWEEFSMELSNHRAGICFEAMGWLLLFFPAHELSRNGNLPGINCDTFLDAWLGYWDSIVHSQFWNCHWMHLFAKLAKHDVYGRLPWQQHLDLIFTHILWVYQVPVGTAVANTPIHESASGVGKYLFTPQAGGLSRNAGKLIVYLLREGVSQGPDNPPAKTMVHLDSLIDLLHQYYHPSNGGSWTTDLTKLMHSSVKHFMKQLSHQGQSTNTSTKHISPSIQQRFVSCIINLASMAQFSKHESLSHSAVKALSQLAYIAPDKVLPLVVHRFQTALETATATHQLVAAIQALAACVRPMLISQWSPDEDPTTAHQMLAQAMMALLPGIDANDEAKTVAVLAFYRSVLSSIPFIPDPEQPDHDQGSPLLTLPVYWEEWLDELITRCTALLENLDAGPSHHAADHASSRQDSSTFLIGSGEMTYSTFLGLLFAKLPTRLGQTLVRRVADFALGGTLQGVVREASVFLNRAATHYPDQTEKLIVRPLMQRLLEEMPERSLTHLSSNLENTIWWHSNLLREALYPLPGDSILGLLPDLRLVINKMLAVNSRLIQIGAGTLLGTAILSLVRHRLPEPVYSPIRLAGGVEGWVDKLGSGLEAPAWYAPGSKHVAAAEQLQQEYLVSACEELVTLCSGVAAVGSELLFKQQLQACLSKVRGVLVGLMRHLRDFDVAAGAGAPICPVGPAGGTIGPAGSRERVAAALVTAGKAMRGRDADSLSMLVSAIGILLVSGNVEYNAWVKARSDQRRIASAVMEPAASTYLQPGTTGWRKRWPLWVALDEVRMALLWRASQAAFRSYATMGRPALNDPTQLPAEYRELLSELVLLSTHQYKTVRNEAGATVELCCKRFTGLAGVLVPQYLATLSTGVLPDPNAPTPALAEAILQAMDTAAAEAGNTAKKKPTEGKTESEQDGLVLGSSNVLNCCITMRRLLFRSPDHFRMLLQALMASRQYTSNASQAGINELLLGICGRLKLPPSLQYTSTEYASLATQFLHLSKPSAQATRWRHTLLANIFTLFLMPPVDSPLAAAFTRHFLELFMSDLLLLRQVAGAGLFFQLLAIVDHGCHNPEVVDVIKTTISTDPQFLPAVLKHMSNGHSNLDMREANKDKRGGSALSYGSMLLNMTFEQIITRVVSALATRFYVWPEGSDIPSSLSEGWFEVGFAAFPRLLGCIAPGPLLAAVADPLIQLADRVVVPNSGSDKAEQCTCAEMTAGLLASGAPWLEGTVESAPPLEPPPATWLMALLERGCRHAPSELVDSWAFAVRFALRGLLDASKVADGPAAGAANAGAGASADVGAGSADGPRGLAARRRRWRSCGVSPDAARHATSTLLGLVLRLSPSGTGPGQLLARQKQLQLISQCVAELRQIGALAVPELSTPLMSFWTELVKELDELASGDLYSVREHLGGLLVDVVDLFNVVEMLPWPPAVQLSQVHADDRREEAAISTSAAPMNTNTAPDTWTTTDSPLKSQVRRLCLQLLTHFYTAVSSLQALKNIDQQPGPAAAAVATANGSAAAAGPSDPAAPNLAQIAHAGFGLQFITKALRKGRAADMRPVLATLLPGLMQLQELAGPQVQHLALEAKSSFVLVKYVPMLPPHIPVVVSTILQAAASRSWSTRAAALVYLQYFWFRHRFLLPGPDARQLEDVVVGRLQDEKAEVRGIAAATLSGMLKAIPPEHASALRALFVGQAKKVLGRKRTQGSSAIAEQAPAALLERQACVQGLKAFVIAHPYDCPTWMPEVLLALAGGSNDASAQVRSDVHKALAEFKRTHEQESLEELKAMMDSDQWDSVNQLTSQASYFT